MALSAKQELAALALAQGKTQVQAAASISAGVRTVRRWCQEAEFKEAIRTAQRESYDTAIARLVAVSASAAAILASIAADTEASAAARIAACKVILDGAYRGYAQQDLERRIEQLEQGLKP